MASRERDEAYVGFVDARRSALVRTAFLLCGDWHRAEDLVQQALVKLYLAWPRVAGRGGEDAYVRRILVNAHLDDWRWRKRRPETSMVEHYDTRAVDATYTGERDLRRALAVLPEGQRKIVVLRFWLDQSVEQVAADLGISPGTVKSQCARGLTRLRALLEVDDSLQEDERSAR